MVRTKEKACFVYVWEFIVCDEEIADFIRVYGTDGDWVSGPAADPVSLSWRRKREGLQTTWNTIPFLTQASRQRTAPTLTLL